ncbi:hypothetical protein Cs7R123_51080 [Catellatospora sp. TT07R-123]|uniref:GGDEF domain-containing protein n=1 Tax=Catellatospora sp. TT07R-123 TaxID=2733863 RepID=UPI001B01B92C|nr:GGDEF domain-containing protein [Catellatospora sp. TT07R-123]GHJ47766.1 hypothetical protein Cs7R123_51080 [Catellatospora sp. TT07R-123]
MPQLTLLLYLTVMLTALGGFFLTGPDAWVAVLWQVAVGYLATAAIVIGARRNTSERAAWYCFAVGIFANSTGILVEAITASMTGSTGLPSVPSPADAFYLVLYPAFALGLALLIRKREARRDWGALVDATMIVAGLSLPAWIFIIAPTVGDQALSLAGQLVSIAYPVGDLMLAVMVIRLYLGTHHPRPRALWLMTGSLAAFLLADITWAVLHVLGQSPGDTAHRLIQVTSMLAYTMIGAAALHPSARQIAEQDRPPAGRLNIIMICLFTSAALIAPALLIFEVVQGRVTDGLAIAVGSIVMVLLVATRSSQLVRRLEQQATTIRAMSHTDDLTGLPNRRAWVIELPRAIERARRDGVPLSVAMLDMDHFKLFNDTHGHPAGDRLLTAAGAAWQQRLREVDYLARYGGEEFLVLLPDADGVRAGQVVDRLRSSTPLGQTFSAGVATWDGRETSDELVARADSALYTAKQTGRDRTVLALSPRTDLNGQYPAPARDR